MGEPDPRPVSGEVELWLRLDASEVRSGDNVRGTLVVHSIAASPMRLTGSPTRSATVIDQDGARVGGVTGWLSDVGMQKVLDPDRIVYLPVLGDTSTSTGHLGPGEYQVVASLKNTDLDGRHARLFLSRPVPLHVTG